MTRYAFVYCAAIVAIAAEPDFAGRLYPALEAAQCRQCHNDNGVASTTRLQFPREQASPSGLRDFGLRLHVLVDRAAPEESLLLRKPTNRIAHAGGERIQRASGGEAALREWVLYLAALPESELPRGKAAAAGDPPPSLRRLTHSQYNNTVRDLLGDETRPADRFPKEDFIHGFTNQADGQSVSPLLAEAYGQAAERLARNAFRGGDTRGLISCRPSPECRTDFVRQFGQRAFRRPLEAHEAGRYERLFDAAKGDFLHGAQLVVEAMLQSPHFLFHLEPGAWGVASQLSYFLWDTMPDGELLRAAERGELDSRAGVERQVRRMLGDERVRASMGEFLDQWLRFDRLRNALRDRRLFPEYSTELAGLMQEEARRLFDHLVWDDGNFLELFSARYTFLAPELARLYELPAPKELWERVDFPPDCDRSGVLGQAAFLTLTSKPEETSPTERGLFVREHFLCQAVPPPPPGVNTTLPPVSDEQPLGNRDRLDIHLSNVACAGCHQLVDPIGFGLERYDAIGRFRLKQAIEIHPTQDEVKTKRKTKPSRHEIEITPAGFIRGLEKSEFRSPKELGRILAQSPACHRCIVRQLFRYAMGRMDEPHDREAIEEALRQFQASNFRFRELIIAIATSEPFLGPGR
jgi:hypothetical protein